MKKLTSRQKQAIATKVNIAKKAMELFKVYGYDSVKIKDICDAAGVSVGAFYHYFESKEKIIDNCYAQAEALVSEQVEELVCSSCYERIVKVFEQATLYIEELGWRFMADMFKCIITSPSKYTLLETRYPYVFLRNEFQKGIDAGEFSPNIDTGRLTELCMKIGRGLVFDWCLHEGSYSLSEETVRSTRFLLDNHIKIQ